MDKKLPILIIIPHGGYNVPDELSGYEKINDFDIFFEADTCANQIFSFENRVAAKLDTRISKLFIDLDRPFSDIPPQTENGVIKKRTLSGKKIFKDDIFPDEIAISNLLRRYYFPFHETVDKILKTGDIKLIIECHTMNAVAPERADDAGNPRPLCSVQNIIPEKNNKKSCSDESAEILCNCLSKNLANESSSITGIIKLNQPEFGGFVSRKYGAGIIPLLKLSLSKALFMNDKHFSYEYMKIDEIRINQIKKIIWNSIEESYSQMF